MPTSAKGPELLVDTSVAVALCVADHTQHSAVSELLRGRRIGLAGHAAFESFSVLTRLPPPARLTAAAAARVIATNFPHTRYLGSGAAGSLLSSLPDLSVAGGSTYDALVAAVAKEHGLPLGTRDKRAVPTYRALEVEVMLIGDPA